MFTQTLLLAATAFTAVLSAPLSARQAGEPATVNFAPYAVVGCRMSENPFDPTKPSAWNVTTGSGCITPTYSFSSYVEGANAEAMGPCALSLWTGKNCQGSAIAATLTPYEACQASMSITAQSFSLACGP